ncbi:MAG: cellulase family glycosylhydrolase [Victivallales bacterium]
MKKLFLLLSMSLTLSCTGGGRVLPDATWDKLPGWRGFNLLEKYHLEWSNKPFSEEDFKMISEFGFNFVRLPMDYRTWIEDGDWRKLNEKALKEIDQAVEWGGKYGIHVCINFHRAPGYSVAKPAERLDLWRDEEALEACVFHWSAFARRYKGIPNSRLSFNLFNEPGGVSDEVYYKVVKTVCEAIRKEDPDRLVISDGLQYGSRPCFKLRELKVAQSARGYSPGELTHYKAEWASSGGKANPPTWPIVKLTGCLFGPEKADFRAPFIIENSQPERMKLRLKVGMVSGKSNLVVKADAKILVSRKFECGAGKGKWKKTVYNPEAGKYQSTFDMDVVAYIPAGTKIISLLNSEGDWMTVTEIGLTPDKGSECMVYADQAWGCNPVKLEFNPSSPVPLKSNAIIDGKWLWEQGVMPWKKLGDEGVGIMVGEFGSYNRTPHDVVLKWMEDCLKNWKKAGWGWALWNFRGEFGIIDSDRQDVEYEDFNGYSLDRKMLELLQKY